MKKLLSCLLLVGLVGIWLHFASGVTASTVNLSRSYAADEQIEPGSIVSLTTSKSKTVTLANTTNSERLLGVAVGANDAVITVNPDANRVLITTSGDADVLVSDLNGDIKPGDKVAVSPFDGIGMKSDSGEQTVGIAQTRFTADSAELFSRQATDRQGKSRELRIGKVQISLIIGNDDSSGSQKLNGLQKLVKSLVGHVVPTIRILVSLLIAVVTVITLIIMIYSALYASIVSIGRNPLAKESIIKALSQVVWIAVFALVLAFSSIYLLLR